MKHNWEFYTRGTIPPIIITLVLYGVAKYGKYNGGVACAAFYCNLGPKIWFAWDRDELDAIGQHILKQTATPEKRKAHFAQMQEVWEKAVGAAENIRSTDLTGLSDEELARAYEGYLDEVWPAHGFLGVDIDAVDILPANRLKERVKKELGVSADEFAKLWQILTAPAYKSYVRVEEERLLKIAQRKAYDEIDAVLEEYWWTSLGWESLTVNTKEDYLVRVKELENEDVLARLGEIEDDVGKIKKEKKELREKYTLSAETLYQLDLFDEYTYWHDLRKEMQCKTFHSNHLFLLEAARRHELEPEDLEWLWHDELLKLIRTGKVNKEEITLRKRAVGAIVSGGRVEWWSGDMAVQKKNDIVLPVDDSMNEARGEGASPGKATGTAKVCAGASEAFAKIEKGDILICGMTSPDYVVAMRKANAIVTDEGGITCHAAIVARELGKPCVIATRVATKIFQDGDKIEVDATKGVVRKL